MAITWVKFIKRFVTYTRSWRACPMARMKSLCKGSTARHGMAPAHPHGAWKGDTTNDILAYAFGNNTKAKLCHPFECVQDTNTVNNCEQLTAGGAELEGKWTPNGMASAAAIMEANPDAYKLSFQMK